MYLTTNHWSVQPLRARFAAGVCECIWVNHVIMELESRQSFMKGYSIHRRFHTVTLSKSNRVSSIIPYRVWVMAWPLRLKVLNQCPLETLSSSTLRLGETQSSEHKMCKGLNWNNSQNQNELEWHSINFSQYQQLSNWETLERQLWCLCTVS